MTYNCTRCGKKIHPEAAVKVWSFRKPFCSCECAGIEREEPAEKRRKPLTEKEKKRTHPPTQ